MVDLRLKKNQQAVQCRQGKVRTVLIRRFMVSRWRGVITSIKSSLVRCRVWDHAVQGNVERQERIQQRLYQDGRNAQVQPEAIQLESVFEEDLGVLVDTKLHMSQQRTFVRRKADSLLGCLGRGITSKLRRLILPRCSALMRQIRSAASSKCTET